MRDTVTRDVKYELVFERTMAAPRDLLFEVWSQPKHIVNWWVPDDRSVPSCEVDFRVGGGYRIRISTPSGGEHCVSGSYLEIDEPATIVLTWRRDDESDPIGCDTVVSATFEAIGDQTVFRLHHSGFASPEHRDRHRRAWSECLVRLESYVSVDDAPTTSYLDSNGDFAWKK